MRRTLAMSDYGHDEGGNGRLLAIRSWALAIFAVAAIVIGATLGMPAHAATNASEQYVQTNIDRGFQVLNNRGLSASARRDQFRQFLLQLTDLKRIAMFALGPAARTASDAEKTAYYAAFEDFAVAVYDVHLSKYRGQTLKVLGSQQRAADDVVVNCEVSDPNKPDAQAIKVAFRVRKSDAGGLTVTDMQVEGVWLAISERADFTAYLQQHGNSVPQLTAYLKQKAQRIASTGHMPAHGEDD